MTVDQEETHENMRPESNIIRIFLSGPSDLEGEQEIVRDVCASLNALYSRHGIMLDVVTGKPT
jgi:hypothetical protein